MEAFHIIQPFKLTYISSSSFLITVQKPTRSRFVLNNRNNINIIYVFKRLQPLHYCSRWHELSSLFEFIIYNYLSINPSIQPGSNGNSWCPSSPAWSLTTRSRRRSTRAAFISLRNRMSGTGCSTGVVACGAVRPQAFKFLANFSEMADLSDKWDAYSWMK